MSNVSHTDSVLFLQVGEEGTLVIDLEVEDAMLVRKGKAGGIYGRVLLDERSLEIDAVERGKHGEFQLQGVGGGEGERLPFGPYVFRNGDAVGLKENIC